jgi:hypothetical protein
LASALHLEVGTDYLLADARLAATIKHRVGGPGQAS